MILKPSYDSILGRRSTAARITEELSAVCGDGAACGIDIEQVAAGVAAFIAENRRSPGPGSSHKRVLVSRALHGLGRDDIARRVLTFGGGLVRHSRSVVTGGDMLVLDLRKLAVKSNERLDIVLLTSLLAILNSLASVWAAADGRGALGLKNVRGFALAVTGGKADSRKVRRAGDDIKSLCRRKIENLGRAGRWKERPVVIEMDN